MDQVQIFEVSDKLKIDIFCKIIDNYGDIGFCWRLCKYFKNYLDCDVRLWVDNLKIFSHLCKEVDVSKNFQQVKNVQVFLWYQNQNFEILPGNIIIESFGCNIPEKFLKKITKDEAFSRLWINLEYLSAERWVNEFHLRKSFEMPKIKKIFFFPGFSEKTGGLILDPLFKKKRFLINSSQSNRLSVLETIAIDLQFKREFKKRTRLATIFCYETIDFELLLNVFIQTGPWVLMVQDNIYYILRKMLHRKDMRKNSLLKIKSFSFLDQENYDNLIFCADLNIVRGEDSFVQAQLSGKPMLWNVYRQEKELHFHKLNAWLRKYTKSKIVSKTMNYFNKNDVRFFNLFKKILEEPNWTVWKNSSLNWAKRIENLPNLPDVIISEYLRFKNLF